MPSPAGARRVSTHAEEASLLTSLPELEARALVEQLPAILYVAEASVDGRWDYVSPGVWDVLGFTPKEWMADPDRWARQVHPEDRERVFAREDELLAPSTPDEYRMWHKDGTVVWVRDEAALVKDADGRHHWHGIILDITDRKLAEAELERGAEQQAVVARLGERALQGADVAELIDTVLREAELMLGTESGGVLQYADEGELLVPLAGVVPRAASAKERSMPGRTQIAASPRAPHARRSATDRVVTGTPIYRAEEFSSGLTWQIEGREGRWGLLWLETGTRRLEAADMNFVQALANILADAIRRRATEYEIRHRAVHDPLTGLPNRVLFLDRLAHALTRRADTEVAVVLLDIDNFKLVNDSLGHEAGDELLRDVATRLVKALRPGDTIARLGGDEFVILVEDISDERDATRVADRIVSAFEFPFNLVTGEHFAKASLGIAIAGPEDTLPASLLRDADAAMYQAKGNGGARFEVFTGAMRTRTVQRLSVENDLRRALERDELRVVYQPMVSLLDFSLVSVEALVRWMHPARGLVSPADFIPIAEESGLIEPIGSWVLNAACAQASLWHEAHPDSRPLGISVNLSAREFIQRDLEARVASALELTGIEPSSLCIEITESVLLQDPETVHETIRRVAALGARFTLDDFGTGYSSLAYLAGLPIDGLKVDRSFVKALGIDQRSSAITTAIVRMAQALSLEVVAEGIESDSQVEALRNIGCDFGQGFRFHRPLGADGITKLLNARRATTTSSLPRSAD